MKAAAETATPSTYSHLEPAGDQQAGSSGTPDQGTFRGKRISSRQSLRDSVLGDSMLTLIHGKLIEDAFWTKKTMRGRQITSADVLATYGKDKTSLRGGFFLEKLCLHNIKHNDRKVTPYEVIQEFNRMPDQYDFCQLAIEDFKERLERVRAGAEARCIVESQLRGIPGLTQATPDQVEAALDYIRNEDKIPLLLASSYEQYIMRRVLWNDLQVSHDELMRDEAAKTKPELEHLEAENPLAETLEPWSKTGISGFPGNQAPPLKNALTLKALEIIQEINDSDTRLPLRITGPCARFFQNRCSSFDDIDIICPTRESAEKLIDKMAALNTDRNSEVRAWFNVISGCKDIRLPELFTICLKDGGLGTKALRLDIRIGDKLSDERGAVLGFHHPDVEEHLVWCITFAEETRLMNTTLKFLADNLDSLTEEVKEGKFHINRNVLFSLPKDTDERIYGLLMHCLNTLHKGKQFIAMHSEEEPDQQIKEQQQKLQELTTKLQVKLQRHPDRAGLEHSVNHWLSTTPGNNDTEISRKEHIEKLLAMLHG